MKADRIAAPSMAACLMLVAFGGAVHALEPNSSSGTTVTITHVAQDEWIAEYRFSKPISAAIFERASSPFRQQQWRIASPAGRIASIGNKEAIRLTAPSDRVVIAFQTWTLDLPKDYVLFTAFSDKSVALYTGHFGAAGAVVAGTSTVSELAREPLRYEFVPLPDERIVVRGFASPVGAKARWEDHAGAGTYVYFGKIKPLETPSVVAIMDPGPPEWLRERALAVLPGLFDYYYRKLGVDLNFKPFILQSVLDLNGPGFSDKGGTLPGLIQLAVFGEGWRRPSREASEHFFKFIAHESAHLWNSQMFDGKDLDPWLFEGASDAFSFRVMRELGVIDQRRYLELLTDSLNDCLRYLDERPLARNSGWDHGFKPAYYCGSTVHLAAEAMVKRSDGKMDLFSIWRHVFDKAAGRGRLYTEQLYADVVSELSGRKGAGDEILEYVHDGSRRMEEAIIPFLNRYGIETKEIVGKEARAAEKRFWADKALHALVEKDCAGVNIWRNPDHDLVVAMPGCTALQRDLKADSIAGISIASDGLAAYDRTRELCADSKRSIELSGGGDSVELGCVSLPKRPRQYAITALP